jgi:hypothetical protein
MSTIFKNLVGRRINGIFINPDRTSLAFRTIDGDLLGYYTHGDCCNTVYINHFQGADVVGKGNTFDLLRGALVLGAEDKEWVTQEAEEDVYEVIEDGFFTIKTDRGYIDLEVRNEHNGYYGGHVEEIDSLDSDEFEELQPLIEDF